MAERRVYVRVRGKIMGPFGMTQLRTLRDRGQFRSFHEVSEDRQFWTSAASLTDLFTDEAGEHAQTAAVRDVPTVTPARAPAAAPAGGWRSPDSAGQEPGPVDAGQVQAPIGPIARAPAPGERPLNVFDALPIFLADPVGGLPRLCAGLRPAATWGLGITFYFIALVSAFLGVVLAGELRGIPFFRELTALPRTAVRVEVVLRLIAVAAIPLLSLTGAIALIRLITRGRGHFGTDVLTAGATALPTGLALPILALLGNNHEVVLFLSVMVMILPVLLLNSALTRWMQLPDRGAIFAVPATLVASLWLFKVIVVALLQTPIEGINPGQSFPIGGRW